MGSCAFLRDRFSDKTFSAVGSKFAVDFEFLLYRHISRSGPWSATYDFGVIIFRKINETF